MVNGSSPSAVRQWAGRRPIATWVFDLDNTLYPARCNLFAQIDQRMGEYISRALGIEFQAARILQKRYYFDHGTTLNGLMLHHGIEPAGYLDYVHDIDLTPVAPSPELDRALARLPGRKLVYTNGSHGHATRVLEKLGVAGHFEAIHDIVAADYRPKYDAAAHAYFVARHDVEPSAAAMFDDIPANLRPAGELGMTTIWVRHEKVEGDPETSHIDHVTDDLVACLEEWPLAD